MARYRRVDIRIWGDQKVRRLSPLLPSGQALWFYLLTNRFTSNVPGLFSAGEAAMAEDLKWSAKGFREAFAEVLREGLAEADWDARVLWIPGAVRYNPPANPNVIKSWADTWDEIPECHLKTKAWSTLKAFAEGLGEGFAKAFEQACPNGSPNSMANQDQDQDQDQDPPNPPRSARADDSEAFGRFWKAYPNKVAKDAARKAWTKAAKAHGGEAALAEACLAALRWQVTSQAWTKDGGAYIPHPATWLNAGRWKDERPGAGPAATTSYAIYDPSEELAP